MVELSSRVGVEVRCRLRIEGEREPVDWIFFGEGGRRRERREVWFENDGGLRGSPLWFDGRRKIE